MMQRVLQIAGEIFRRTWLVLGAMAPWVLGGFLVAGVVSLWLNARVVRAHFGGRRFGAVFKAVALGIPLPVCSCGVIPLGATLRRHGAGKGSTAAFLMSTPQTGVDSIAVTYGLMGGLFAVIRPLAALVSGLLCGLAVGAADSSLPAIDSGEDDEEASDHPAWWRRVIRHGFVVLPASVGGALVAGAFVSALVMTLVPENAVAETITNPLLQMVLTLVFAVPVYICSTAAVPFALGLLAAGLSPGAALAFLIGGPGVSASTLLAIWRLMGARTMWIYLLVLSVCAFGFGLLLNLYLPPGWMPAGFDAMESHAAHAHGIAWTVHAGAGLLLAVIAAAKWLQRD